LQKRVRDTRIVPPSRLFGTEICQLKGVTMRYFSTRDVRQEWPTTLDTALGAGLATDGGLYVPESLPTLHVADFRHCHDLPEVAQTLLAAFFLGSSLAPMLGEICRESLDLPMPLVALKREGSKGLAPEERTQTWLLELFHGPTAAFKDFAARFLAACLSRLRSPDDPIRTVLVATSGDTGSAVAAAFHKRPGFRVVILYPNGRVSARQAHQLGAFGDNIHAFCVDGSFDDCQRMAKHALADRRIARRHHLTSANSISLGRLLPQMAYYAYASLVLARRATAGATTPSLVIPTGNLGNALAAILVREIGLPIGQVHLATNANATLSEFFAGAPYRGRPSTATLANAMDVGDPSNFERLSWFFRHRDLRSSGIFAHRVEDARIAERIAEAIDRYWQVLCPHTACALDVAERLIVAGESGELLLVATAHPAKFDAVVEPLIGKTVPVPPALAAILQRPAHAEALAATDHALVMRLEQGFDV